MWCKLHCRAMLSIWYELFWLSVAVTGEWGFYLTVEYYVFRVIVTYEHIMAMMCKWNCYILSCFLLCAMVAYKITMVWFLVKNSHAWIEMCTSYGWFSSITWKSIILFLYDEHYSSRNILTPRCEQWSTVGMYIIN